MGSLLAIWDHCDVLAWVLPRSIPGSMALLSLAPVTTKGKRPELYRVGPAPHYLQH